MKIVSFNINSLRVRMHQLQAIIKKHQPDILGLQEIKVNDECFPIKSLEKLNYYIYYHGQKAHYGVALFCKKKPIEIYKGFPHDSINENRRIISIKIKIKNKIINIINGYFPQGDNRNNLIKFSEKRRFYHNLLIYLKENFSPKSDVIVMGDMNVSASDYDIGIHKLNKQRWIKQGKCSFLPEEKTWIQSLKDWGLIDTYRKQNPKSSSKFSWFDYRSNGFAKNIGLRVDLILASESLFSFCTSTGIDYEIRAMDRPSDHAPVWANFDL